MTSPEREELWAARRRLGDALRRWAGLRPPPAESPPAGSAAVRPPPAGSRSSGAMACRFRRLFRRRVFPLGRPDQRDRGAATILVLAIGLVMVAAGVVGAAVGSARVGRHQAQVAADLGALAGARHAVQGRDLACAAAGRFVAANAARMSSCVVDGLEIVVSVDVPLTSLPGPVRHASGAARAGPVYAVGS